MSSDDKHADNDPEDWDRSDLGYGDDELHDILDEDDDPGPDPGFRAFASEFDDSDDDDPEPVDAGFYKLVFPEAEASVTLSPPREDSNAEDIEPSLSDEEQSSQAPPADDVVDDFLDNLDPPEAASSPLAPAADVLASAGTETQAETTILASSGAGLSRVESLAADSASTVEAPFGDDPAITARERTEDEGRTIPLTMIAVLAGALILLGVGGYGVLTQREEMRAEIRELQARLATTMSPEESSAARERQRQLEVDYEALSAEVATMQAENQTLRDEVSRLQEQLIADVAAARAAQAEAEAQAATAAVPAAPAPNTDIKGWFVNFSSYTQRTAAERWAERLNVREGSVVVQSARDASGRALYRVRVAGLANRDTAERIAVQLEREFDLPRLWVGKN